MARIILIDDDRVFARLVQTRLTAGGHTVDWNEGAFGVLTAIRRVEYQVILMDVQMPEIEGTALLSCLRTRGVGAARVILMSSLPEPKLKALAVEAGADAYFPKQHNLDNLARIIDRWMVRTSGARVLLGTEQYELRKII
jgi:DNA-binding response OmpR family regulator